MYKHLFLQKKRPSLNVRQLHNIYKSSSRETQRNEKILLTDDIQSHLTNTVLECSAAAVSMGRIGVEHEVMHVARMISMESKTRLVDGGPSVSLQQETRALSE